MSKIFTQNLLDYGSYKSGISNGMKSLKIYLLVVCSLLVVAILFGVYVWYKIQTLELEPQEVLPSDHARDLEIENAVMETQKTKKQ